MLKTLSSKKILQIYIINSIEQIKHFHKLLDEQIIEDKAGKDTVMGLVSYFRNECISRIEDKEPDFDFFKNGNGNGKAKSKQKEKDKERKRPYAA
jgi:hypothetical protein